MRIVIVEINLSGGDAFGSNQFIIWVQLILISTVAVSIGDKYSDGCSMKNHTNLVYAILGICIFVLKSSNRGATVLVELTFMEVCSASNGFVGLSTKHALKYDNKRHMLSVIVFFTMLTCNIVPLFHCRKFKESIYYELSTTNFALLSIHGISFSIPTATISMKIFK